MTQRERNVHRMKLKNLYTIDTIKKLKGKTIKTCRYMTDAEMQKFGWSKCSLIIIFTDGTSMYASNDNEGNEGGSLFTNIKDLYLIPTI